MLSQMGEAKQLVESSSVLCEKVPIKKKWRKAIGLAEIGLFVCVLVYRVLSLDEQRFVGFIALACESVFAMEVMLFVSTWWTPVDTKTNVERLLEMHGNQGLELPRVDMFVTTADAAAEPAIVTVNTVLSLMAAEYPEAHKLACYVSDDGNSPLLLHALSEASLFARIWVPFCKKYGVQLRAPFRYFASSDHSNVSSPEFRLRWIQMKDEYEAMAQRIENASKGDLFVANTEKGNHPAIVKVILENKEDPEGLPQLIYVCREKRPNHPHHYKAGAMNVLTRVSGLITNAPYMLNVDCDMYVNNPTIVLQAMCAFIGLKPQDSAFVQFPQTFYDGLKDDPFANQMSTGFDMVNHGMAGIQGPTYAGTGCFHRRKRIYGFSMDDEKDATTRDLNLIRQSLGDCDELLNSAVNSNININTATSASSLERVAGCEYERGTAWGKHVGWGYESIVEDLLTGMRIQSKGWSSVALHPDPPGFMGMVPGSGPATLVQRKRWTTGLLQILLSHNSPFIFFLRGNLRFRQCLTYSFIMIWGIQAVILTCYALLPAYSIIANTTFLPKVNQPAMLLFVGIFMTHHLNAICSYLAINKSIRTWWNYHRMTLIVSTSSDLFGVLSFVLERLGTSDISFDLTQKNQPDNNSTDENANADAGRFTFDESPMFVPATTVLLLNLIALGMALFGLRSPEIGELFSSLWVVLCFWPFVRGLFGNGKYGIPSSTLFKSATFAYVFVTSCA